jgi:bifunctional enzyme CysN/CysC
MTTNDNTAPGAFPIVIVGHVDHGKSTLIGRLLHDTGALPEGKAEELRRVSKRRGTNVEWSFALDALQVERDQAITVDSTQIWFTSAARRYVIIDAPGHGEFLRNMITGAAQAEAAVIVVDAAQGMTEQTRRHAYLLHLLGVSQTIVAVNKMDKVGFDAAVYERLTAEIKTHLESLGVAMTTAVPMTARDGDNLAARSPRMPWWRGPTLLEALDGLQRRATAIDKPLRLAVQDVYREGEARVVVGRIESGRLKVGDSVRFWPTQRNARIKAFETWYAAAPMLSAAAPQSVAFTLAEDIFVERGHVAAAPDEPPHLSTSLQARIFWLGQGALTAGRVLKLRVGTAVAAVTVTAIHRVLDVDTLSFDEGTSARANDIAEVTLDAASPVAFDVFHDHAPLGRGVLIDGYDVVAGCVIDQDAATSQDEAPRGAVIWLAGLSGAGKSTLAAGLHQGLTARGVRATVLDGDILREGLNADLGFSPADRAENLRRTAEVAKLMLNAGLVVIAALISPTASDRRRIRNIIGPGFHEIYVNAGLDVCEARDVKGLYAKARQGVIADFTGVSAAWEPPSASDLELHTAAETPEASLKRLMSYVETTVLVPSRREKRAAG